MALDEHLVASTALTLIDRDGLRALTMRELATTLGVTTRALYHYYPGREELLEAVAQLVLSEVEAPTADLGWRVALERIMRSFRAVGLRHPNVVPLLMLYPPRIPDALAFIEAGFRAIIAAGFSEEAVAESYRALAAYSFGTLVLEVGAAPSTGGYFAEHPAVARTAAARTLATATMERHFPTILRVGPELAAQNDDVEFERGLKMLLDGFESQHANRP